MFAVGGALLALVACAAPTDTEQRDRIKEHIEAARGRGPDAIVDLSAIDSTGWTTMYVFRPYSGERDIDSVVGFHVDTSATEGINMNDGIMLLLFADSARIITHVGLGRRVAEFCESARARPIPRSAAKFVENAGGCLRQVGSAP